MKRIVAIILVALAAAALFAGLVHVVLVASHLSTPAVTTVQGLTPRRLWATAADALARATAELDRGLYLLSELDSRRHELESERE